MAYSHFDHSNYPIVVVSPEPYEPTQDEFEAHLARMKALYTQHKNIIVIFDGTNLKYLSGKLRIRQGEWLKENRSLAATSLVGAVYMMPGILQKLIVKGIFVVHSPEWEHKVVGSMRDAMTWAKLLMKRKGLA